MAQDRVKFNGVDYGQPNSMVHKFATTDSSETTRSMKGELSGAPLFVVEAYDVTYEELTAEKLSALLHVILRRPGYPHFTLHHYSAFYGAWRNDTFYVTEPSADIKTVKVGKEKYKLQFSMTGINPL